MRHLVVLQVVQTCHKEHVYGVEHHDGHQAHAKVHVEHDAMLLVVQAVQLLLILQPGLRDGASSSAAREASDLADELASALVAVEDEARGVMASDGLAAPTHQSALSPNYVHA